MRVCLCVCRRLCLSVCVSQIVSLPLSLPLFVSVTQLSNLVTAVLIIDTCIAQCHSPPNPSTFVFYLFSPAKYRLRTALSSGHALWSGTNKNRDVSTGPLARSLAPLTRSLAPDCSLRSRPPLRSIAHSLARGKVNF